MLRLHIAAAVSALPLLLCSCRQAGSSPAQTVSVAAVGASATVPSSGTGVEPRPRGSKEFLGFDRNEYPGDNVMAQMRKTFDFTGYWLTVPPGAMFNQWQAKRDVLRAQGWGFLVLANGKLEKQIIAAQTAGAPPKALGQRDGLAAVAAATAEGFPAHTILFLDQEEGGRLTDVQAAYLLGWTETVAASNYKPGVYASGQLTSDDPGPGGSKGNMIDTIRDIRERVARDHLHEVAFFDAQDTCPPSNGCTVNPKPMKEAGEPNLIAWQYSQSPRRPSLTRSCAQTYAADGNCYAPGFRKCSWITTSRAARIRRTAADCISGTDGHRQSSANARRIERWPLCRSRSNPKSSPLANTSSRISACRNECWSAAWLRGPKRRRRFRRSLFRVSQLNVARHGRRASSRPPRKASASAAVCVCLSGERTGFAYTDDLSADRLMKAARTAALIASGPQIERVQGFTNRKQPTLYPVTGFTADATIAAKLALIERADKAARAYDSRIVQVRAGLNDEVRRILIAASDGTFASDIQPLARFNCMVIAKDPNDAANIARGSSGGGGRVALDFFQGEKSAGALRA